MTERVTIDVDGEPMVFRVPDLEDLLDLDGEIPLLPADEAIETDERDPETKFAEIVEDPQRLRNMIRRHNKLLVLCALDPVLTEDYPAEPAAGTKPVRAISSKNRFLMAVHLLSLSGFNDEATAKIRPLSETAGSSNGSTPPESAMGNDPMKCSPAEPATTATNG